MHRGFIKVYRKIKEWGWYSHPATKDLFLHLLLECNHKPFNFMGYPIARGSVVVGRHKLSEELGFSERKIRTALNNLKTTNEVTIKTTSKFSVISIVNYEIYQSERPSERPTERPAFDQQTTTIKECKNDKNTVVPTATKELLDHFRARFKTFRGVDYRVGWGKDSKLFKEMLSQVDKDSLKGMVDEFFKSKDQFVMSSDYGVGVFRSQINKLNKPKKSSKWETVERL